MKIGNIEDYIHVLDPLTDTWSVIRGIANSGKQEDAFYVCDVGDIINKYKIWKEAMPRVEPHYAIKCNDSLTVLDILAAMGTGFDCASKAEINKVLSLGVQPDRIIYANPAKPASHIRHAESVGVSTMTFDNVNELHKVKDLHPNAKMVIRIRCDAVEAQCQLGMKFGCDPITEAPQILCVARSLGIDVVGVSFHVGSGCKEPGVFKRAISAAHDLFDFAASLGFNFYLLDIGGGFPGDRGTSIKEIADVVNEALDIHFPDPSVQVIAEPGRFFVSSAYTLACNVHSIRSVQKVDPISGDSYTHHMYFINDGVYGSFNCILYDHQRVVPIPLDNPDGKLYSTSIWGPTCDGLDQVIEEIRFPEMQHGDWIVFENMGAYTLPVASPFNGFPIPKVHVVVDEDSWLILKDVQLTEDHFMFGNIPASLRMDLGDARNQNFTLPELPIRLPLLDISYVHDPIPDSCQIDTSD